MTEDTVIKRLREALLRIERWDVPKKSGRLRCGGKAPDQHGPDCWLTTRNIPCNETSYIWEFGSNGERDWIRSIARKALDTATVKSLG